MITFLAIWLGCGLIGTIGFAIVTGTIKELLDWPESYVGLIGGCITFLLFVWLLIDIYFNDND
jgi:hypothetical protein